MATKARSTKSAAKRPAAAEAVRPTHLEPLTTIAVDEHRGHFGHDHADHDEPPVPAAFRTLERYRGDLVSIVSIIGLLTLRESSPWAILVVSFNDDPTPSPSLASYQQLFTGAGTGTLNMVDYFSDMSHGKLDLSASQVFGPYVLDRPRGDYVGNVYPQPAGKLNRNGVLDLAKATATAAGVNLSAFAGVVVCGTPALDLCGWVGGFAALCDDGSAQPSLLGQEMGHGYGLDHSRLNGSDDDYQDMWDTMSTANAFMASHPTYGAVGPGLNAWNMRLRGWLRESRVLAVPRNLSSDQTVTLRPLHARGLSGNLAIDVGGYLIEFRHRSQWDSGIPRSCILVHRAESNRSYLMTGTSGNADLVAGDRFEIGVPGGAFAQYVNLHVDSIDEVGQQAVVSVHYDPFFMPHIPDLVGGKVFGGIAVDGGGFIVINGKVIKIPPRGPVRELIESVGRLAELDDTGRFDQPTSRQRAVHDIVWSVGGVARDLELVSHTPPRADQIRKR